MGHGCGVGWPEGGLAAISGSPNQIGSCRIQARCQSSTSPLTLLAPRAFIYRGANNVHILISLFIPYSRSLATAMASDMPLPVPPRTPTPPPDDENPPVGLGFDSQLSPTKLGYNPNALSPLSATFPSERYGTLAPSDSISQKATPSTVYSPTSATFPYTPATAASGTSDPEAPSLSGSENVRNPFNFQPVSYMPGRSQGNKPVGQCVPCPPTAANLSGHWPETRAQVQAQQRFAPDLP